MTLLGALLTAGIALLKAWRRTESDDVLTLHRVGFCSLVYAVRPAWPLVGACLVAAWAMTIKSG